MAQKRMIDKKISLSEQVADLSDRAAILFTWSIPHSDDVGLLPRSHRTLKAAIVPMWECTIEEFDGYAKEIVKQGLWQEFEYKGDQFYALTKFQDHQTLKRDRQPQTRLNITFAANPKDTWQTINSILVEAGIQMEDNGNQMDSEEKGSEGKKRKVKRKKTTSKADDDVFDRFWSEYPNKKAKKKARESWDKIDFTKHPADDIIAAVQKQKQSKQWMKDGGAFIPHPTTWLNQERWTDEVDTTSNSADQI
jgi:hypothetical protein